MRLARLVFGCFVAQSWAPLLVEPTFAQTTSKPASRPVIVPKIWDAEQLADWATPVAGLGVRPGFVSEKEYYAAPVDNLRTYPVYHPRREPPGYRDWIKSQGPQRLIEPERLSTKADWIEAGRIVFEEMDGAGTRTADPKAIAYLLDADAVDRHGEIVTKEGTLPLYRWVVDKVGSLQVSAILCGSCHLRVGEDGTLIPGAVSNLTGFDSPAFKAMMVQTEARSNYKTRGQTFYADHGVPWLKDDIHERFRKMPDEEFDAHWEHYDIGSDELFDRFNGSPYYTTRIADLRGVKDRRYLDATGTHVNRGPEDIARYGILVEFADHGVFGPYQMTNAEPLTERPSDEAMYALGLFLYSLEPPPSPHPFDEQAKRGQKIFEAEGCGECHTPPIYTNNKLVPAPGFEPPEDAAKLGLDVSKRRVGTDPGLALKTRKGTGYYKIPSLRGLWRRGLYEHCGSVASLEDWFDPKRLRDDYVPSGWKGPGVKMRAVPGHKFGHDLSDEDKKALIAFLRTL